MENKPLKRHPALVEISKDHHQGLLLCWKIRTGFKKGVSVERIAHYVEYFFREHLVSHFKLEEEHVFSCLVRSNPLRLVAEKQHQELYELARQVSDKDSCLPEVLTELEHKLESHIRFEEREVFMYIQETLSEKQLQDLQKKVEASHSVFQETWQDPFWERG